MAIKPIDTEVFVQNLKQAYTILRQNILICNTMVEMINNFNSLNTTGEENASDIEELQSQVSSMNAQLTQLDTQLDSLNTYVYNDISEAIAKRVVESDIAKIVYGNAPTSPTPFEYQVVLSDETTIDASDRSIPTTAWVNYKVSQAVVSVPNETELILQDDYTYALQLKHNGQILYTDTSINKLVFGKSFEWSGTEPTPETKLSHISQLEGGFKWTFDVQNIDKCPPKIICKNVSGAYKYSYVYMPLYTNGVSKNIYYYCITNISDDSITISVMNIALGGTISFKTYTFNTIVT